MQYDECIRHCGESIVPGSWTTDELSLAKTNPVFARAVADKGLVSGVFFPIHGVAGEVGLLALNSRHPNVLRTLGDRIYDVMAKPIDRQLFGANVEFVPKRQGGHLLINWV